VPLPVADPVAPVPNADDQSEFVAAIRPVAGGPPQVYQSGWFCDPEAVEQVRQSLPPGERYFGDTPAGKAFGVADTGADVLLSDAIKHSFGKHIPTYNQGPVGSCVGAATAAAVKYLLAIQMIADGLAGEALQPIAIEPIYAGGRVQIGVQKRGARPIRGDGLVTAWAGEWCRDYGMVRKGVYGPIDLRTYSPDRCRQWGRTGVPDELIPIAKQSPVKGITFARNADELAAAIRQGYPAAIGSSIGFGNQGPHQRDKDGFLRRSGTWGHCMAYVGVIEKPRRGFLVVNSWGEDWVKGPTGGRDIPAGSFFADWATVDAMCREGDAVVFSDAVGFPARNLWFDGANAPRQIARGN
jgi:hypothetical protein